MCLAAGKGKQNNVGHRHIVCSKMVMIKRLQCRATALQVSISTCYICRFQKGCTSSYLSAIHMEVYRVALRVMAWHRQVEAWS